MSCKGWRSSPSLAPVRGVELCSDWVCRVGLSIQGPLPRFIAASGPARLSEDKALNLDAALLRSNDNADEGQGQ